MELMTKMMKNSSLRLGVSLFLLAGGWGASAQESFSFPPSIATKTSTGTASRWISRSASMVKEDSTRLVKEDDFGRIEGVITTNDQLPAAQVTVLIKETGKTYLTNLNGAFSIGRLQPGTYTLEVSLVGYETLTQSITVQDGKTEKIALQLQLSNRQLEEIIVLSGKTKFAPAASVHAAKMPLSVLENPQTVSTVGKQLIKEQMLVNVDDALRNTAGIDRLWSATGRAGDGAGYFTLRGFSVQPTMVNGLPGLTNGGLDPAGLERIELIKGPSGTLFGSSLISFGGLINLVTKRPYEKFGGEVSYTVGGFGLHRITADVNTPLDRDGNTLFRVNTAYHTENSWQDAGFRKSFYLAPSLSHRVSEKLQLNLYTEFFQSESTNPLMVFINRARNLDARSPEALRMDYSRSYTSNDLTIKTPTTNIQAEALYQLNKNWTSQTVVSSSNRRTDGYYSYVMFLGASDSLLSRLISRQNGTGNSFDIQQNFNGDFKIGNLRNRVVLGVDVMRLQTQNNNTGYAVFDVLNVRNIGGAGSTYGSLTQPALDARLANQTGFVKNEAINNTYSAYVSNVLNITPELMAMVSLRFDHFENRGTRNFNTEGNPTGAYSQNALSPKFGLVYQVVPNKISLFGNYMNGFRNVAPVVQPLPDVENTFRPQQANQLEGGVKMELFSKRLFFTATYYNIHVTNLTRPESIEREGVVYNITVQNGEQRSRGLEFELQSSPIPGLQLTAAYAYNDSRNEKTNPTLDGRRVVGSGPAHLGNAWASYTQPSGKLSGFGVGIGLNYASENIVTNNSTTGQFILPEYTILNATAFYQAKKFRVGVKGDNLANTSYFRGWTTVEPQMPRRFLMTVSVGL